MGEGVLCFITDNSYLDNITFRGMRQSLMNSFSDIYILDLHGNSNKGDKALDGSKDENVFDIQQGVSVVFFIKHKNEKSKSVVHNELFGLREKKYEWLNNHNIKKVKWNKLEPKSPYYFFIPGDEKYSGDYNSFISLQDILSANNVGVVTARDKFAIDFEMDKLKKRIKDFTNLKISDDEIRTLYKLKDTSTFKLNKFRRKLSSENWENQFTNILYRPFDYREIVYTKWIIERPIYDIMRHMLEDNIGLIVPRQFKEISGAFVTKNIIGHKTVSAYDINSLFPLYLYRETDKKDLFSDHESGEKKPNIKQEVFEELKAKFKKEVTPEEIFYYIYAVLYSNTYRTKYAEFLKIDFPRIPFTKNYKLFIKLGKLGKQLADLHLLKSNELNKPISKYSGKGDNKVTQRPKYESEKIYINGSQYFTNVKAEVWNYQIGGYQVCDKWLKDRKGRELSLDEIKTYCKIVTALSKTIELQKEIDKIYEGVEK